MNETQPRGGIRVGQGLARLAGLIFYVLGGLALISSGVGLREYLQAGSADDLMLPAAAVALAVCYVVIGYHLRRFRLWARNFAFAFAAVSLLFFPVGTVLGALVVVCIDRANRAGVFPKLVRPAAPVAAFSEEEEPLLRFEPARLGVTARDLG